MKLVTAIVRPEKLEVLKDALHAADISGMTISQVQGCGKQHGWSEYYRGTEVMLDLIAKVKFEIVLPEAEVSDLIDLIVKHAHTGEVGDGKIFVYPVEQVVRIRTQEKNLEAI
jgi:nitrogen regulatory protein P-II 1